MNSSSIGNVLIGSFVSAILFAVPGGPAIGGGIAGYLDSKELERGAIVGGIVGLASATAVVLFYSIVFQTVLAPGLDPRIRPGELGSSLLLIVFLYSLVLSVGGGVLGSYLQTRRTRSNGST